ncbi:hypothetical protein [Methylobacterium sp. WSM2598]|uniref:hypothetical protein n=1 Tax=Methylobacterium sp. WSM2598 TaxID=398261 RepID=UPI00036F6A00|nr:hypothetical protein [Methylobacterium sp. WSM2598]
MWLAQAFYADEHGKKWQVIDAALTPDQVDGAIRRHKQEGGCHLVELWQHAGCFHAIG